MRILIGWILAWGVALAVASPVVAGEQEDALAVVEQAIKAHGGSEALNRAQTLVRTGSGTMSLPTGKVPFTDEWTWSLPERFRMAVELDKKARLVCVVNADKGWQSAGGPAMEMGAAHLRELRDEMYVLWTLTLTPLTKAECKLSLLPEIKVNGEPAVGVKVTSKGNPELKLYFDKKSHLLVKIERRAAQSGQLVDKEYVYSNHKEFDGVKLPTKEVVTINNRQFSELNNATYKLLKQVESSVFAKP